MLRRLARLDQPPLDAVCLAVAEGERRECRTIVDAKMPWWSVQREQLVQQGDDSARRQRPADLDRQPFPVRFVDRSLVDLDLQALRSNRAANVVDDAVTVDCGDRFMLVWGKPASDRGSIEDEWFWTEQELRLDFHASSAFCISHTRRTSDLDFEALIAFDHVCARVCEHSLPLRARSFDVTLSADARSRHISRHDGRLSTDVLSRLALNRQRVSKDIVPKFGRVGPTLGILVRICDFPLLQYSFPN